MLSSLQAFAKNTDYALHFFDALFFDFHAFSAKLTDIRLFSVLELTLHRVYFFTDVWLFCSLSC